MCLAPRGFCRVCKVKQGGGLMQAARLPLRIHLAETSRGKSLPLSGPPNIWDGFLVPCGILAEPPGPSTTCICRSFSHKTHTFFMPSTYSIFLTHSCKPLLKCSCLPCRAEQSKLLQERCFQRASAEVWGEHISVCNKLIRQTCRRRARIYQICTN